MSEELTKQDRIIKTRAIVGAEIGLKDFNGSAEAFRGLSPAQKVALNDAVGVYISNNPVEFNSEEIAIAEKIKGGSGFGTPLEENTLGTRLDQFGKEFVKEAEKISGQIGFSFSTAIGLILAGVVVVMLGPQVMKALRK